MEKINIYIETSVRGPRAKPGAYLYLIEWFPPQGAPGTQASICFLEAAENQMALEALVRASERIRKPAQVRVFTRCGHILGAINNQWPQQWKQNGWKNAKGQPVRHENLWERLLCGEKPHSFTATEEDHTYRDWMSFELNRRLEEHKVVGERKDKAGSSH